jgi:DegV family protein with EDD domain
MANASLITDSNALLPDPTPPCVTILPILIHLPGGDLRGDDRGSLHRLYEALERGESVKSSAPTPADYVYAIEEAPADEVMVITPAQEFTTMLRNAEIAAATSSKRVVAVDSRTAAAAQGLIAWRVWEAIEAGANLDQAVSVAREAIPRAELVAKIQTLDLIRRSGRVPSTDVDRAQQLGVQPVFRLYSGAIEALGMPQSTNAALKGIARAWETHAGRAAKRTVVFHAAASDQAVELQKLIGNSDPVTEFSPAMAVHTGAGVAGVAWLK